MSQNMPLIIQLFKLEHSECSCYFFFLFESSSLIEYVSMLHKKLSNHAIQNPLVQWKALMYLNRFIQCIKLLNSLSHCLLDIIVIATAGVLQNKLFGLKNDYKGRFVLFKLLQITLKEEKKRVYHVPQDSNICILHLHVYATKP